MNRTEVNTQKMRQVAADIDTLVGNYRNLVNRIYDAGYEIDNMWEGEAKKKFKSMLDSDRWHFDELARFFEEYAEELGNKATLYEQAEQNAQDILNNNTSRKF